jgi:dihydropteroate synthase
MRPVFHWNLGSRSLELGKRTLIMGILNVTPDSFSDGGEFFDGDKALKHGLRLLDEGADIVDIGGESTRPGARVEAGSDENLGSTEGAHSQPSRPAPTVSAEEELKRVIPVITGLKKKSPDALISVDTYKAAVARAAVEAGAEIVNDVSGFRWDGHMLQTLADLGCGAVLMHMRGRPEQWRNLPPPEHVVSLVKTELGQWAEAAASAGVQRGHMVLDPGFGFGKSFDENYPLIAHFEELHSLGFPLLAGTSRKSFLGRTMGGEKKVPPSDRLFGTIATETALVLKGAHIVRTHDVMASVHAARVADAILCAE